MFFIYILVALAFAILVVLFGRWVYHRIHKSNQPAPSTNQTNVTPATPSTPQNQSPNPNPNTSQSNPQPTQVANTGPGNVIALFVGTAILVGGIHFVLSVRRAS
jgi:hypothetical protein